LVPVHCTHFAFGCIVEDAAENIAQISAITMGSGAFISSSAVELMTTLQ
jgi:hypothetical protein